MKNQKKSITLFTILLLLVSITISVNVKAQGIIKLNKTNITMIVGNQENLKVKNTMKTIKWSSSNKKIAKVSQNGVVTAKKEGTAIITARVGKKKLTCKVTVKEYPQLDKKISICVGKNTPLKVTGTNKKIKWSSSNKKIVKVNKKGIVTGLKKGTAIITAKVNNKKLTCKVKVKSAVNVSITTLPIKKNIGLIEIGYLSDKIYCTSSNTDIATVEVINYGYDSEEGCNIADIIVYGHKSGTTNITITNNCNNEKAAFKVEVDKTETDNDYQKLLDYILLNGTINDSSDKVINKTQMDSDCQISTSIEYAIPDDVINYSYIETNTSNKITWYMMPTEKENTEYYITLQITPNGSNDTIFLTATIDLATYNGANIVFEEGWYKIVANEALQITANDISQRAFTQIKEMLNEKIGISYIPFSKI